MTLPSLRRNFAWTLAGNVIYAVCQWGMLVVLAKIGSTEVVGRYALGLAVTAPVFLFFNLRLRAVQATDARGEYPFAAYWLVRLVSTLVAMAVVVVVAVTAYDRDRGAVIMLIGAAKAVESMSDLFYGVFQQRERMDLQAGSLTIRGLSSVAALWLLTTFTGSLAWGLAGQIGVWLLVLILFDAPLGMRRLEAGARRFSPGRREFWRLVRLTIPLGLVTTLTSLRANVPRYFIDNLLGEGALGIFAALAYVVVAGSLVSNALNLAAAPRLAKHYAVGERAGFRRIMSRLIAISVLLGSGGVVVAHFWGAALLRLVYAPGYAEHTGTFALLTVASAMAYLSGSLQTGISAKRSFSVQFPIHLAGFLATLGVSAALVPRYGIRGAAWAVLAGAAVEVVLYSLAMARTRGEWDAGSGGAWSGAGEGGA